MAHLSFGPNNFEIFNGEFCMQTSGVYQTCKVGLGRLALSNWGFGDGSDQYTPQGTGSLVCIMKPMFLGLSGKALNSLPYLHFQPSTQVLRWDWLGKNPVPMVKGLSLF